MKRINILGAIKSELTKSDRLNAQLLEMSFYPINELSKFRSAFCILEDENIDELQSVIDNASENIFNVEYSQHNNIDETIQGVENFDNSVSENNWRGRLFLQRHLENKIGQELIDFLFKSYWRILVKRNNGEFFTRHDVVPYFWSPGFSIGGKDDYESEVLNQLDLFRIDRLNRIDHQFDVIKVFANKENVNTYLPMNFSPFGEANNTVSEVKIEQLRIDSEIKKNNIIAHLRNYFSN